MAEPAWKASHEESEELDQEPGTALLQRWVERPDGSRELLELPLTPELFLNPELEDKMVQGELHSDLMAQLKELVGRHFASRRDVKVLMDVKHLLGPGLPGPSPDISVVFGMREPGRKRRSFDVVKEGVVPSLIIEIISPFDARIRRTDEVDKVELYEQIGVDEYILVETPRKAMERFGLKGYRLGRNRCYGPIEPDGKGRLLSQTAGLLFGTSPDGNRVEVFEAETGERMLTPLEIEEARRKAEQKAAREGEARRAAEEELARLRAEIERLKKLE